MIEFNGRNIKIEIDYNMMCELEAMGISLTEVEEKPLTTIRALLYISIKKSEPQITIEAVGVEMGKYFASGGSIDKIGDAFQKAIEESGFFPKNNK